MDRAVKFAVKFAAVLGVAAWMSAMAGQAQATGSQAKSAKDKLTRDKGAFGCVRLRLDG